MKMNQFSSFKELISTPVSEREHNKILGMIDEIYNTSYLNEVWIGVILDFLNGNNEDKHYSEYYLTPEGSYGTRKYTYRFISTEEDMPHSITDADVQVLKRFNAQPKFILYDYEEQPSSDIFAYLEQPRTLRKCLESIGMTEELKEHLCEFCFYRVKEEMVKEQQKSVLNKENVELLFKNHDFENILKALSKCGENLNVELLYLISINAQNLLSKPNANIWNKEQLKELIKKTGIIPGKLDRMSYEELVDFYNEGIVRVCEDILILIISISSENYECFGYILEQLYKSENDNVRLHCCANGDYTKFLNDPSPRVSKVANIRYLFDKKWNSLSDDDIEKQRINFLISACKNGKIGYIDYDILYLDEEDKSYIGFSSVLFNITKEQPRFDSDILYTIKDKRILADALNELIKHGEIILNDDMVPDCFKFENETSQEQGGTVLTIKPTLPKSTDN